MNNNLYKKEIENLIKELKTKISVLENLLNLDNDKPIEDFIKQGYKTKIDILSTLNISLRYSETEFDDVFDRYENNNPNNFEYVYDDRQNKTIKLYNIKAIDSIRAQINYLLIHDPLPDSNIL